MITWNSDCFITYRLILHMRTLGLIKTNDMLMTTTAKWWNTSLSPTTEIFTMKLSGLSVLEFLLPFINGGSNDLFSLRNGKTS